MFCESGTICFAVYTLGLKQEESVIELEIQAGKFICLLDEKWDLKRLFRVDNEDEKTTRLK